MAAIATTTNNLVSVFSNIDYLTLVIAVAGWLIALWLQRNNTKHQHQIQVRYDIYKQLLKCSQETQGCLGELGASAPPLILMDSSMIPFTAKLTKEYKGQWIPYSEQECVFDGSQKWQKYIAETFDKYFAFVNQYHEMMVVFEGWAAAIEPLMCTQKTLTKEIYTLQRKIHHRISKLQMYGTNNGYDWRKWNKEEVESIARKIQDDSMNISSYIEDFMVLVHNELVSKYFGYQKPIRKTLDPQYKVLTEEGFVQRVEKDHEQLFAEAKERIKKENERIFEED